MRLFGSVLAIAVSILMVVSSIGTGAAAAPAPIHVRFLFDLGDGTFAWVNATISDPAATNATWDAMQSAATRAGLWISWTWYSGSSGSGIFITDLGNRSPPTVAIFVWDAHNATWNPSPVGVTDLVLADGAAVALADTDYNPVTYDSYPPAPTPDHPFPAAEFRNDVGNSGATASPAPRGVQVLWDRPLVAREIESSPIVVGGRVYVLTIDGMFALDETTGAILWSNPHIAGLSTPAFYNGTLLADGSDGRVHAVAAASGRELWNVTLLSRTLFSGITSSPKLRFDTAFLGTLNESGGSGEVVALGAVNGTVLWRHTAPGSISFSSPAVVGGTVYVGIIGRYNTTTQITYDPPYGALALDAGTGTQRWFVPLGASVAASPVVAESSVFVPAKDGFLYALNATTGALQWKVAVQAGVSSPAYHAGTLFIAGGTSSFGGPGLVTAVNASTGDVEWTFQPNGVVQSSVTYADGLLLFSTNAANGTIYAIDAADGSIAWAYTPSPEAYIFGSPSVADGMVFAPSDNGHVYAFAAHPTALMNVSVDEPTRATRGEPTYVNVTLHAFGGRVTGVSLNLSLIASSVTSASPTPASIANSSAGFPENWTLQWWIPLIPSGGTWTAHLTVDSACLPPPGPGTVIACGTQGIVNYIEAGYSDSASASYPTIREAFLVTYWSNTSNPGFPLFQVLAAAILVLGVTVAVAVYVVTRRRKGHGPQAP